MARLRSPRVVEVSGAASRASISEALRVWGTVRHSDGERMVAVGSAARASVPTRKRKKPRMADSARAEERGKTGVAARTEIVAQVAAIDGSDVELAIGDKDAELPEIAAV